MVTAAFRDDEGTATRQCSLLLVIAAMCLLPSRRLIPCLFRSAASDHGERERPKWVRRAAARGSELRELLSLERVDRCNDVP